MLLKSCVALGLAASAMAASASGGAPAESDSHHPAHEADSQKPASSHGNDVQKKHTDGEESGDSIRLLQGSTKGTRKKRRTQRSTSSAFNSDDVDTQVKITWCNDNQNFCGNVCLNMTWGAPINDGCDSDNLQWHCTCGNGKNPDPDVYTFPVMHYQCQYEVYQCQNNCATGDIRCTQECQGDRNCTAPNDPNLGKTTVPETDEPTDGLDSADGAATDPVNFFSTASVLSTGGYVALTAVVAASFHFLGLP
ncbi:hypothetical protein H4S08_002550 [Coemansia sp. RSA 1365]|nr:hypothetical protein H4S08_002550 [Coemansia sp. RSA 1365]